LAIIPFPDITAVAVALAGTSPAPEAAALLLFFTNRTFARCIYKSFVIAIGAWGVDIDWRGCVLGVEGVEDADRCGIATALLLAFPRLLSMRWAYGIRSRKG
jgi:hypothetical protein